MSTTSSESTHFHYKYQGTTFDLYRTDCIAGMRQLECGSIDVVVTSPPYNLGVKYNTYDDTGSREGYLDWIDKWTQVVLKVLDDRGSIFLNVGAKPSDPWGPFEVLFRVRRHLVLQNVIHWIKSMAIDVEDVGRDTGVLRSLAVGHYKPINSPRFLNDCHEYIFHLTKHGDVELDRLAIGVPYQDKSNVTRWRAGAGDIRCRGNTWFVPYRTIQSRESERPHPATFPVKVPKWCILLHGRQRVRRVLDPFFGIGHTALACKELGVDFLGYELDESYFSTASQLLRSARQQPDSGERVAQLDLLGT